MTKVIWVLLTITFLDKEGQPLYFDGWSPTIQPSMEICTERKSFVEEYLVRDGVLSDIIDSFTVECIEHSV